MDMYRQTFMFGYIKDMDSNEDAEKFRHDVQGIIKEELKKSWNLKNIVECFESIVFNQHLQLATEEKFKISLECTLGKLGVGILVDGLYDSIVALTKLNKEFWQFKEFFNNTDPCLHLVEGKSFLN